MNSTIQEQFESFHANNPRVYDTLVRLAREAISKGKNRGAIKMLWEVVRWEFFLNPVDDNSDFALNNNYHSRYARLIDQNEPDLKGFFKMRALKSA